MNEKADHLIERAAALLRADNPTPRPAPAPGHVVDAPDRSPPPGQLNGSAVPPLTPARPNLRVGAGRPGPAAGPMQGPEPRWALPPPVSSQTALAGAITSAADIAPSPLRPPITLETLERAGIMVARNNRTRVAEEYRIVIGRVLRALHEDPAAEARWEPFAPNVVMITSARPAEGKSFTALNMAASIAQNAAESVLLIDMDAKVHSVSDEIGVSDRPGFMDLIADPNTLPDDVVLPTELPNFAFMPLGNRAHRRGEDEVADDSFDVRPITPAIHRVSQRFPKSLIVLDCPPCLSTSDPHTLAPHVAQVVMVVEAERTQRNDVEAALELVRVCPNVTMLLNKVRVTTRTTFGTYDYFGSYT